MRELCTQFFFGQFDVLSVYWERHITILLAHNVLAKRRGLYPRPSERSERFERLVICSHSSSKLLVDEQMHDARRNAYAPRMCEAYCIAYYPSLAERVASLIPERPAGQKHRVGPLQLTGNPLLPDEHANHQYTL